MRLLIEGDEAAKVINGWIQKAGYVPASSRYDYKVSLRTSKYPIVTVDGIDCDLERRIIAQMELNGVPEFRLKRKDGVRSDKEVAITYPVELQQQVERGVYQGLMVEVGNYAYRQKTKKPKVVAGVLVALTSLFLAVSLAHSQIIVYPPGVNIRDEGVLQCRSQALDFVGASVDAVCSGGVATLTIAGGAGGPHAATHENAGADEISVLGLSGLLADGQTPLAHDIITAHNGFPGGATTFLRDDGTFAAPPGGGGAPTDALYWVGALHAGLSAEKDLSGFTGLVLNTAGVPTNKGTNTCINQFARSDNTSGVWTCSGIIDADVPDTITINTAGALTADPADCATATHFAVGVNASGTATCEAIADADVPDTISLTNLTQIATRAISDTTGTLATTRGGTELTAAADDNVMVGNGTLWQTKAIPDCDADTTVLHYDTTTNAFSCGDDDTSAGGPTTLTSTTTQSDAVIATYTAITGLSFTAAATTNYLIDCYIIHTSTAATTGINFAWDTPASPTGIWMTGFTTTSAVGLNEGFHQNSDNVGTTTGSTVVTVQRLAHLTVMFKNAGTSAAMTLGFTPETANSVSVIAGSVCQYRTF